MKMTFTNKIILTRGLFHLLAVKNKKITFLEVLSCNLTSQETEKGRFRCAEDQLRLYS